MRDLEGHEPVEFRVAGFPDCAESAHPDTLQKLIFSERLGRLGGVGMFGVAHGGHSEAWIAISEIIAAGGGGFKSKFMREDCVGIENETGVSRRCVHEREFGNEGWPCCTSWCLVRRRKHKLPACATQALGMHEFMLRMPNRKDRTRRLADDFFGHAAQEHVGQTAVAVRSHNDEVGVDFAGAADDFVERRAFADVLLDLESLELVLGNQPLEARLDRGCDRFGGWQRGGLDRDDIRNDEGEVLHDVKEIQLGIELFGERDGVIESGVRILAEIDGKQDAAKVDHGAAHWRTSC